VNHRSHRFAHATTNSIVLSALIAILVLAGCAAPASSPSANAPATSGEAPAASGEVTTLTISGAFALFPMVTVWVEEYSKLNPNIQFDVQAGGAGKGMTDVLAGAVDIAMVSREVRSEELDQGAFPVPVTIDAVVGTINADNPYLADVLAKGITPELAQAIWVSGTVTTWGEWLGNDVTDPIHVYTRSDASGAGEMWAKFSLASVQDDLKGTAVNADPGLAEAVRQDPLGVGYNNIGFTYNLATGLPNEGLQVIPIDLNGNGTLDEDEAFYGTIQEIAAAIAEKRYPYPPARPLYLVTKGEPTPEIIGFYRWILTEGQALVPGAGYINLPEADLQAAQALLGE
jgi:phosphate transport system substrate-binding protein